MQKCKLCKMMRSFGTMHKRGTFPVKYGESYQRSSPTISCFKGLSSSEISTKIVFFLSFSNSRYNSFVLVVIFCQLTNSSISPLVLFSFSIKIRVRRQRTMRTILTFQSCPGGKELVASIKFNLNGYDNENMHVDVF